MRKVKKSLISAVLAVVVAVTAMFGTALSAGAVKTALPVNSGLPVSGGDGGLVSNVSVVTFTAGVVADSPSNNGDIGVNWFGSMFNGAKYAVYYIPLYNGRFGEWSVTSVDGHSYNIVSPVKNATYYITILPYVESLDTTSPQYRLYGEYQYGAFSPYKTVTT